MAAEATEPLGPRPAHFFALVAEYVSGPPTFEHFWTIYINYLFHKNADNY